MSIFHIDIQQVNISILNNLIDNKIVENKFMDYKGDITHTFLSSDEKLKQKENINILKDIVSFANSGGGDIIFGISENKEGPTKITGLEIAKIDGFKRKVESLMASHIEPRIPKYEFSNPILLENDNEKAILIIRIYPSFIIPHFISHPDEMRFWYRTNSGNTIMDLQQVKSSFGYSQNLESKVKGFLMDRINMIQSEETPYPLRYKPLTAIHFLPIYSFYQNQEFINLIKIQQESEQQPIPIHYHQYNIDGWVGAEQSDENLYHSYIQYFRNGVIELVTDDFLKSKDRTNSEYQTDKYKEYSGFLHIREIEKDIKDSLILKTLRILNNQNYLLPIWIQITFINIKDFKAHIESVPSYSERKRNDKIRRDIVQLPLVIIDKYDEDLFPKLLPIYNFLWNLAGYEKTKSFDDQRKLS